ncbi:MAG: iron-sulfur cluster assembly protein [Chloroflexota bacterium]|nr:iron-sulfur cluster assembly protein [Chloroflexota bacterium]
MTGEQPLNIPIWDVEETDPDLVPALEEALSEIVDPEIGLNVIQLGLIRNVAINDDDALVTMILTTPFCPYGPSMMETTRKKVEKTLDRPTKINYGRETWDPTMMEEGLADDWGLF